MQYSGLPFAALAVAALFAPAAQADDAALRAEVEALRVEVSALRDAVRQMRDERSPDVAVAVPAPAAPTQAAGATAAVATPAAAGQTAAVAREGGAGGTNLWGYGELNYNHPTARAADSQADLRRAVIGFSHAFDDTTRVYGELEWEHAVTSADDQGESEVEQLYVEHALGPNYGVRAGLMLVPLGLLNEHHEPTNYYGVERNFIETAIIPSTWREGGVAMYGNTDAGFNWNVGIGTGPDLGKWDPASDEGRVSPLGSIHQELQLAKARDASIYAALNWQGVPGLDVGGGVFTGKIGQGAEDFPTDDSRLFLGEAHVRWQTGPFDLSALYTRGTISDTQDLNLTFLGQTTPVPKAFWGGYVQGAWRAIEWNQSSLLPFLRYEAFNTGAAYASQPQGLGTLPLPTERVWTAGANYYLNPNVVFKIDYQRFNRDDTALGYGNRFDLGLGYQF
jgi:phosphate-selective porin